MNIVFISEKYAPYNSGVPIVVRYLAEGLVCEGHIVSVYTTVPLNSELKKEEWINGVRVKRFELWRNSLKQIKGDVEGIRNSLLAEYYDCVIFECGQAASTDVFLNIMKSVKPKRILHAHGLSGLVPESPIAIKSDIKHTIGHLYNWLRMKFYYKWSFKHATKYIDAAICLTNTDSGYSYLSSSINKCFVLGNAVEDMFFEETDHPYESVLKHKPYCVSIANFTVVKNQLGMMREFYQTSQPDYSLILIGSQKNSYYKRLLEEKDLLDKKYGPRNIVMMTGVNRYYFPFILDNAELYLVSSTYEEYSISLIEAMSRGVAFVSTNVGNANQLPGGVVVNSISNMHEAIDSLLLNDEKREQLGSEAKAFAIENCKRSDAIKKLERILSEVVSIGDNNVN